MQLTVAQIIANSFFFFQLCFGMSFNAGREGASCIGGVLSKLLFAIGLLGLFFQHVRRPQHLLGKLIL